VVDLPIPNSQEISHKLSAATPNLPHVLILAVVGKRNNLKFLELTFLSIGGNLWGLACCTAQQVFSHNLAEFYPNARQTAVVWATSRQPGLVCLMESLCVERFS
jgi:hypothetical protein